MGTKSEDEKKRAKKLKRKTKKKKMERQQGWIGAPKEAMRVVEPIKDERTGRGGSPIIAPSPPANRPNRSPPEGRGRAQRARKRFNFCLTLKTHARGEERERKTSDWTNRNTHSMHIACKRFLIGAIRVIANPCSSRLLLKKLRLFGTIHKYLHV